MTKKLKLTPAHEQAQAHAEAGRVCTCSTNGAKVDGWTHAGHQLWVHTVCNKPSKGFLAIYQAGQSYSKDHSKDHPQVDQQPVDTAPQPKEDHVPTQEEFLTGPPRIARSIGGRPIILGPDGKLRDYTRCSSLGSILDDETALWEWKMRQLIVGICSRKELVVAVNAHSLEKEKLKEIIDLGLEASGSNDASVAGTAVHALCERFDRGEVPYVDDSYADGVDGYLYATAGLETIVAEEFGVCDDLQAAGTPDRIYRLRGPATMPDGTVLPAGTLVIGDVKTCRTLDYGGIDFSVQLALYARSCRYDIGDGKTTKSWKGRDVPVGERSPWVEGEEVNQDWAIIVWIPSGSGEAELRPVDLQMGWKLAQFAEQARQMRKAAKGVIGDAIRVREDFYHTLDEVTSVAELTAAYHRAVMIDAWDDELKADFSERKAELIKEAA